MASHLSPVSAQYDQNCPLWVRRSGSAAEINAEMLSLRVGGSYLGEPRPFDTNFEEIPCDLAIVCYLSNTIVCCDEK